MIIQKSALNHCTSVLVLKSGLHTYILGWRLLPVRATS